MNSGAAISSSILGMFSLSNLKHTNRGVVVSHGEISTLK